MTGQRGFRSLSPDTARRIVELARDGNRPGDIHKRFPGLAIEQIYYAITKARQAGEPIPKFPRRAAGDAAGRIQFHLAKGFDIRLEQAAEKRGLSPSALVKKIIETIAAENMFDAVLDDDREAAA